MRRIGIVGLMVLLVVAAGWSALWFYAAHEAGRQLDAWLKSESAQGRAWTCPDRVVGGYPLALTVACSKPTFTGRAPGEIDYWTAARLDAEASLTHMRRLVVRLGAPLTYRDSNGQADVKASWNDLEIDVDGLPETRAITLHGTDVAVDGNFGGTGRAGGGAKRLDAAFDLTPQAAKPDIGFTIAIKGTAVPPIDELLGGQTPVDIDLSGRLDQADVAGAATLEEIIERWRVAGGRVALASSRLSRGEASVSGSGNLGLDGAHRLQGRLAASFVGLEPVLKRYGISGNIAAAGSLLNALFGGGQPAQAAATPGALNLPISFNNGRVGIGPIRTPIGLPPLY